MVLFAAIRLTYRPNIGHRFLLSLRSADGSMRFEIPEGLGAFNYLSTEKFRSLDWASAVDGAYAKCGSLQPLGPIEVDADEADILRQHHLKLQLA